MRNIMLLFAFCSVVLLQGCVTTLPVNYVAYDSLTPLSDVSQKTFQVANVEDIRAEKKLVGYAKNLYGMKMQEYMIDSRDITGMLKKSVEDMLTKDGHMLGQGGYEIQMKLKELWTEQSTHFATVEYNTRITVEVILVKGGKDIYVKDIKARTSTKSGYMGKKLVGETFSNVVIEFVKELSRDPDFIQAIS